MDISIFTDKQKVPGGEALIKALGDTYPLWMSTREYVRARYPGVEEEWAYPGSKYGWSFRMKDKKRAIVYLLPRDQYFMAAFVFGRKAYEVIMESRVAESIKDELAAARVYAEGRGIRIEVRGPEILPDIMTLVDIKLSH